MKAGREMIAGAVLAAGLAAPPLPAAAADDAAQDVLAAKVRDQGLACGQPQKAERDPSLSKPDEAAWILTCDNATYRIRLIPDMAAKIERIGK